MKIDFDKIDDANVYEPLPAGKYLCELTDIEETFTQSKDEMWNLKFVVLTPLLHEGRVVFDRMVFSEKAMSRIKLICSRFGIDTKGTIDLKPGDILHKKCYLHLVIEEYFSEKDGTQRKRNRVPFGGYEKATIQPELTDDEIPF
jgi:hypothetical protein